MKLRNIKQIKDLKGKRVLLRLDLNVPLTSGRVARGGQWRLQRAVPTIKYLVGHGAKVIIVAHLGRPKGVPDPALSLRPVARSLGFLLKKSIQFWPGNLRTYESASYDLKAGQIAMLENIRFEPREKLNCQRLARAMSRLADIYVNDAFGNIHRQDASMHAITKYLPSYAGLLIEDEIYHLSQVMAAKRGLVVIFGGAKISTKIKLIKKFTVKADSVLVGGALANTLLRAAGHEVGRSLIDEEYLGVAKKLLNKKVHLPQDLVVALRLGTKTAKIVATDAVPKKYMILDIGPKTIKDYIRILSGAKLVVWNGPFGYFENKKFVHGSKAIMQALARSRAKVIIGGGETVELAQELKLDKKFDFISTGGGAMLTFLEGGRLPSLERLRVK